MPHQRDALQSCWGIQVPCILFLVIVDHQQLLLNPAVIALSWQGELVRNCMRKSPAQLIDIGVNLVDHAFDKASKRCLA